MVFSGFCDLVSILVPVRCSYGILWLQIGSFWLQKWCGFLSLMIGGDVRREMFFIFTGPILKVAHVCTTDWNQLFFKEMSLLGTYLNFFCNLSSFPPKFPWSEIFYLFSASIGVMICYECSKCALGHTE